jgi:hypothetical protein
MIACCAHSLGMNGDVGVRKTAMNSTSDRKPSGRANCSGRTRRNRITTPPAASTAITLRMSRVRRAGNTFTSSSVSAAPITLGMRRNGIITPRARNGYIGPPSKATPYAASIGTAHRMTIQLELTQVSNSLAPYSCAQSTGALTSMSRSRAKKKLDSAVMMFDSSRMEKKLTSIRPSSLPASSGPISGTPLK